MFFGLSNLKHATIVVGSCNVIGYGITTIFETHKITDLVGCGAFVITTLSLSHKNKLLSNALLGNFSHSKILAINIAIILWGTRLSTYLFQRVLQIGEDKRLNNFFRKPNEKYLDIKQSFYPIKLGFFWMIQAMWGIICLLPVTLLNSLPLYPNILSHVKPNKFLQLFSTISIIGIYMGILIEGIADYQKSNYRSNPSNKDHWCDIGLWKYSRYPNYFGEMCTWWSVYFSSMPLLYQFIEANVRISGKSIVMVPFSIVAIISILSPTFITYLLLKLSGIPLLEQKYQKQYENNKDYKEYIKQTYLLIPFPYNFYKDKSV